VGTFYDSGNVPLYRYYNGKDHFYTTNSAEIGTKTPGVGYINLDFGQKGT
jgi:hypothetical protein